MDKLLELRNALILVTRAGLGLRVLICFIKIAIGAEEDLAENKKQIKTSLIWLAIAESIIQIQFIVTGAYT